MDFRVEHNAVPINVDWFVPRPFMHDQLNFQLTYEKRLCLEDVTAGYLVFLIFLFYIYANRFSELHVSRVFKQFVFSAIGDC